MTGLSGVAIIGVVGFVFLRGWMTETDMYTTFLSGAEKGMRSAIALFPVLCGMLMMLGVVNASGVTEWLTRLLTPVANALRLPAEITPLILLRPLTGSGSLAALESIYEQCGPDSRAGRIASVMMGSSETIFYTMTVYLGAAGVKKVPHAMGVSLLAYMAGVAVCGWLM